jgi:phosphoglycolate phosphatase
MDLFFDLDGTLTDSGEGIMRSAQYALSKMGIEVDDYRTLRKFVGPPLEDSFIEFYGMSAEEAECATAFYRERFAVKGRYENYVYAGIGKSLQTLSDAGHRFVIATSRTARMADEILRYFHLRHHFIYVGGRDEEGRLHSKTDVLLDCLAHLHISAADALMIGDRHFDIDGAREVGMPSMGVLWGYGDRAEMEEAAADYIVESPEEMVETIARIAQ